VPDRAPRARRALRRSVGGGLHSYGTVL
jgi:hypothetical protein